jgi:hypothetical protein
MSTTPRIYQNETDPRTRFVKQRSSGLTCGESIEQASGQRTNPQKAIKETKPVRTLFYVPGSSVKMIDKAWTLKPDNIVCALEVY